MYSDVCCKCSVSERLCRGIEEITPADLPAFLWPKGVFTTEDPYKGFLHGPLLVMVGPPFFIIFELSKLMIFDRVINTSSSPQVLQGKLTSQHVVATLHCMTSNLLHMNPLLMLQQW